MSISGLHLNLPGWPSRPGRTGRLQRPSLPVAAALSAVAASFAWNLVGYFSFLLNHPWNADFFLYYLAAQVGLSHGWAQIYNPSIFLPAMDAAGVGAIPYLNPPPMAWLAVPLSFLPYPFALTFWQVFMSAAFLFIWRLVNAGSRLYRYGLLLAGLGLYPIMSGLRLGQVIFLVMAGVAACWWLIRHDRPFLAGLALGVMALKPQAVLLVPLTLLLAGYWRVLAGFALVGLPLAGLSLLALGEDGIRNWRAAMDIAYQLPGLSQQSVGALIGPGPLAVSISIAAGLLALLIAWRSRGHGPELSIAVGLAGSVLITPYVNIFDLTGLVLSAWLVLRLNPPGWVKAVMVAGYLPLEFGNAAFDHLPLLLIELAWLLSIGMITLQRPRRLIPPQPVGPRGRRARRIVVLPAYRAQKTVRDVVNQIPRNEVDGILLVDDASSDRTAELAMELGVDVIKHPSNLGYGGNQKTCYTNALLKGADVVVMLHPDGQYDASLVPALCRAVEAGKGDVVLGSRWLGLDPSAAGMPGWKRLGNRFLTWTENQVLGLNLSEYHTGYRAYSRRFLETIPFAQNANGFVFDSQVLIQAAAFGFTVAEIPAVGRYFNDASSIGLRTSITYGLKTLAALTTYILHRGGLTFAWLRPHQPVKGAEKLAA
jgi:hypothetical protein